MLILTVTPLQIKYLTRTGSIGWDLIVLASDSIISRNRNQVPIISIILLLELFEKSNFNLHPYTTDLNTLISNSNPNCRSESGLSWHIFNDTFK